MKRAHCVIVGACSWLAGHSGALIIGLAVVWMTSAPRPAWGQWNGTNPVWTYSNVGIGTNTPVSTLQVVSGASQTNATFGTAANGAFDILALNGGTAAFVDLGSNVFYNGNWNLRSTSSDGWMLALNTGAASGWGVYHAASGSNPVGLTNYLYITPAGYVGIGTTNPQYLLSVKGTVGAEEFIVTNTGWSDYVFQPGYRLRPLSEVGAYIRANGHLPDIPSEAEVKEKGVSVGDMQSKLLAKVEELTLHMIQAEERNNRLEEQNRELRDRIGRLEKGAASSATPTAAK
jgi:hypothetical protein